MSAKFKANTIVRIVNKSSDFEFLSNQNLMVPNDSLIGQIGVVRATFNYYSLETDYDVAIIGRKYKSHHQYEAISEQFLESVTVN